VREPGVESGSAGRSQAIDVLRALAALSVLAMHVGHASGANVAAPYGAFTSHLNVGVTLFFLITGFLLYRPWAAAFLAGRAGPSLASYARRRILRIVPAYWFALTVLATWPGLKGVFTEDWWVYYGFAQSYRVDWTFSGLQPAWSLSVEMHYYALLPVYAGAVSLVGRGRGRRVRLGIAAGGLVVLAATGMGFCFELTGRVARFWSPNLSPRC
jgi:peptidoglycan/LPS O-acetylase OafA/YrhL